jgi:hypothetical protein
MPNVTVIVSDGKIWQQSNVIVDIVSALRHGPVMLNLLHEGPCCQTSGIDKILTMLTSSLGVDSSQFTILTSNQLTSSAFSEKRTSFVELDTAAQLARTSLVVQSNLNKRFGIFIGRSNWQRLGLASHLWCNYKEETAITFHFDHQSNFHISNFGLEEFVCRHWEDATQAYKFVNNLPMTLDKQTYPILWNQTAFNLSNQYKDIFCEIICETFFSGKTFMVTEKTFRCIINGRPFMVQGPQNYLQNLKRLGFETFSDWWDEGYDLDHSDARYLTLKNNIEWIASLPFNEISSMYKDMQHVLTHNIQVLQNLTHEKILSTNYIN